MAPAAPPPVAPVPPVEQVTQVTQVTPPEMPEESETQVKSVTPAIPPKHKPKKSDVELVKAQMGLEPQTAAERKPMTGFLAGSAFSFSGGEHWAAQLGIVHSRPMTENVLSLNVEGNILIGGAWYPYSYSSFGFFGFNVPVTALMQWGFFSLEAGADMDLLFGDDQTLFNAGFVVGAGIGFSKKHSRRYFYRYCGGYNFGTHVAGMWWLF